MPFLLYMAFLHLSPLCFLYTLLIPCLCFPSHTIRTHGLALPPAPSLPSNLTCTPSHCGTVYNISFPFFIADTAHTPTSCGLPEFRLTCNNTHIVWWPEHLASPLSSILTITSNHITYGTFVAGPPPFSSLLDVCSPPPDHHPFPYGSARAPFGLQFHPHDNIRLLTNCSDHLTSRLLINETVEREFSFSSPNCLQYYSVCSNDSNTKVPCLEAISAEANDSLVIAKYGCQNNITLYELPKKENKGLSLQFFWAISQGFYDCKACERSNGSCTSNNVTNSFECLCGDSGSGSGSPSNTCSSGNGKSCKGLCRAYAQSLLGAAAIAAAILVVGGSFVVYCCRKRARIIYMQGRQEPCPISTLGSPNKDQWEQILACEDAAFSCHTRKFSYRELSAATDGFSESKVLGDGGFGTVFEGTLAHSAEKVAVKRLFVENSRRIEQFLNEIRILSTLHHPNLVRLHGFCCEDFTELLLVYEFASNGSLADNLHGMPGSREGLSWEMRLCIALETAGALAYMHQRDPPVLHRDVKSSNILLDGDFHAKLADFGLSRRVDGMRSTVHVSTAPQGTPGYVDPQYQQCYRLTDKSDVYSFGVVLMELISGKAPVDMSRGCTGHINLSSLAIAKIQTGALEELIDPCLLQESGVPETVARVAELAFVCLAPLQEDRPSMAQVALALLNVAHSLSRPAPSPFTPPSLHSCEIH